MYFYSGQSIQSIHYSLLLLDAFVFANHMLPDPRLQPLGLMTKTIKKQKKLKRPIHPDWRTPAIKSFEC